MVVLLVLLGAVIALVGLAAIGVWWMTRALSPPVHVPRARALPHSLWCRIVMANAARRVCMCGASPAQHRRGRRGLYARWR